MYQVSNYGAVKSLPRYSVKTDRGVSRFIKGKTLLQRLNTDKYPVVKLSKGKHQTSARVHKLVAEAFLEKPNDIEIFEVNHKDFNRENNKVENLEWLTHPENVLRSHSAGRYNKEHYRGEGNPNYGGTTLREKFQECPELKMLQARPGKQNGKAQPIRLLDLLKRPIKEFSYIGECAEYLIDKYSLDYKVDSIRCAIPLSVKNDRPYLQHYYEYVSQN